MSTYRIDGTIVKTENATQSWDENTRFDGSNHISVPTGSQWAHQTLYRSRRGRYWLEHTSHYQSSKPHAEWLSPQGAARWLLQNEHGLPVDLVEYEDEVCE